MNPEKHHHREQPETVATTDVRAPSARDMATIERWMNAVTPRVLVAGWGLEQDYANAKVWRRADGLLVIAEVAVYQTIPWLHVSTSFPDRIPAHEDLRAVKAQFVGDRLAVQVFPQEAEYVNDMPFVLHLWCKLVGERLTPDFRKHSRTLGRSSI
jgi:hypothetical protein